MSMWYFELYYNGHHRSTNISSFQIDFVIQSKYNLQTCLDYWKIIIMNISPLQTKKFGWRTECNAD